MPVRAVAVLACEGVPQMMCDRCEKPINAGEAYETIPIDSATGAAASVTMHKKLCGQPFPPRQTAPVAVRKGIRGA